MNDKSPKVTVLMSVYNSQLHLKECIESVLDQTFTDFEFLILDDFSTDNSKEIIRSYKDSRIRLIENSKNLGLAASLNKGLNLARGEYIARMDADDVCRKERLKKQAAFLDSRRDIGVCGTFFRWIRDGKKSRIITMPTIDAEIKAELLFKNAIAHPTVMIRASVLKEHEISYRHNYTSSQDYALWADLINKTNFANLPDALLFYRLHEKQISATKSKKESIFVKEIQSRLLEELGIYGEQASERHHRLFMEEYTDPIQYLLSMLRYLTYLAGKNRQAARFKENIFTGTLGKRWFELCRVAGAGGHGTFGLYRKAKPAVFYKPPIGELVRFFIRSCSSGTKKKR